MPFPEDRTPQRRYYLRNTNFAYADGITLYAMLRHARPRRIIDIGSGFTSAAMLDTIDLFLDSLPRPADYQRAAVIQQRLRST
jgi:hypothetical protein